MGNNNNHLITTKVLSIEDLHIGKYVQTFGNADHIYQIVDIRENDMDLRASHIFKGRNIEIYHFELIIQMDNGCDISDIIQEVDYKYDQPFDDFDSLCETIITEELNIDVKRSRKLELLGI